MKKLIFILFCGASSLYAGQPYVRDAGALDRGKLTNSRLDYSSVTMQGNNVNFGAVTSLNLFQATGTKNMDALNLFQTTGTKNIDALNLFQTTGTKNIDGLNLFQATGSPNVLGLNVFQTTGASKILALESSTETLLLYASNTNYFNLSSDSQTKSGYLTVQSTVFANVANFNQLFASTINNLNSLSMTGALKAGSLYGDGSGITNIGSFISLTATQTLTGVNTFDNVVIVSSYVSISSSPVSTPAWPLYVGTAKQINSDPYGFQATYHARIGSVYIGKATAGEAPNIIKSVGLLELGVVPENGSSSSNGSSVLRITDANVLANDNKGGAYMFENGLFGLGHYYNSYRIRALTPFIEGALIYNVEDKGVYVSTGTVLNAWKNLVTGAGL